MSCLIVGTSFSDDPPAGIVNCSITKVEYNQYSRVAETFDVECPACELRGSQEMYNDKGRLIGTLYSYELGSEPIVTKDITCVDSRDESESCTQTKVRVTGWTCYDKFVPCREEDNPECLETR
ncbi:hypothetical protein DCO56_18445 [Sphingobacterium athyrii]|uniref:Uncharacterized protein n=1 Tax=Sphingobacterium athyrii TaxID=2152717 RepID=A0A363NQ57_9SPHI|nr:hypothetical protein DCO56_18445 [Sphingobacterium athyrii]